MRSSLCKIVDLIVFAGVNLSVDGWWEGGETRESGGRGRRRRRGASLLFGSWIFTSRQPHTVSSWRRRWVTTMKMHGTVWIYLPKSFDYRCRKSFFQRLQYSLLTSSVVAKCIKGRSLGKNHSKGGSLGKNHGKGRSLEKNHSNSSKSK